MLVQKLKLATAALMGAGLMAWGASAALISLHDDPSQNSASRPESCTATAGRRRRFAVRAGFAPSTRESDGSGPGARTGRTARPRCEGLPHAGNLEYLQSAYLSHEYATSGPDGRFQFLADRAPDLTLEYQRSIYERTVVSAAAPNYGVAWAEVPPEAGVTT